MTDNGNANGIVVARLVRRLDEATELEHQLHRERNHLRDALRRLRSGEPAEIVLVKLHHQGVDIS